VALFAQDVPEFAVRLMTAFWPGPLTLIFPKKCGVADAAAGGHATIALRCPAHLMAQAVLQAAQSLGVQGVAAPSANLFGSVSPTTAAHVREAFPSLLVLDGGACDVGIESTIVDCSRGTPVLLRPGMLSLSQLSQACGVAVLNSTSLETTSATSADALNEQAPAAPGSLASHYAPRARLRLLSADEMLSRLPRMAVQVALWSRTLLDVPAGVWWVKMPSDAAQCAHELFAQLRAMDAKGVQEIWVETPPEGEAWDGVRDRLQRAAALK
jgi:L-threonylcarbamoyladenylate synthase